MKNGLRSMVLGLTMVVLAPSLNAQDGTWRIIGSANWLERTGGNEEPEDLPPVGSSQLSTDFESGAGVGLAIAYFLNDHIALEARGTLIRSVVSVRVRTAQDSLAVLDLGEINMFPLAAVLQYHIPTSDEVQFFVGAGAGYLIITDIDTPGSPLGDRVEFDETIELVLNAGFNWHFDEEWGLNVDARYVPIETDAEAFFAGVDQAERVSIEPVIISAGISYRF